MDALYQPFRAYVAARFTILIPSFDCHDKAFIAPTANLALLQRILHVAMVLHELDDILLEVVS